jgi:hypothetical protein
MVRDITAAIDPKDLCTVSQQLIAGSKQMVLIPPFTDRVHVLVLGEEQYVINQLSVAEIEQLPLQGPRISIVCPSKI